MFSLAYKIAFKTNLFINKSGKMLEYGALLSSGFFLYFEKSVLFLTE